MIKLGSISKMCKRHLIFTGGLGNQMFQYALLLSLKNQGFEVKEDISYYDFFKMHNGYELERVFGIKEQLVNKQGIHMLWLRTLNKLRPSLLYEFDKYYYNENVVYTPKCYIFGYWQDERYFGDKDEIKRLFSFREIDAYNATLAKEMQSCNSVSLHVRRGDYAAFGMTVIEEDYYRKAIEKINSMVDRPVYYIFSDDIEFSKKMANNLGIVYQIISHNRGIDSYKDMYLMSNCKHNIIANSSFSWWGAWLNGNKEKIVIAPQIWDTNKTSFHPQCKDWILL